MNHLWNRRHGALIVLPIITLLSLALPVQTTSSSFLKKTIALTFDDGPRPVATRRLQAVLAKYDVPATLFIVGRMGARHPRVVQSLARAGHEIASHSWSHPDIRTLSPKQFRQELNRTRRLIRKLTGKNTRLFRTPGSTRHYLEKRFRVPPGYNLVLWSLHSMDHQKGPAKDIVKRVLTQAKNGDIVLLHNGSPVTVAALDVLIPALKKRGYDFVTMSALLEGGRLPNHAASHSSVISG